MVLGKHSMPGRPTVWIIVGQGPTVLAVGANGVCLDIFTLIYLFSPLSPSLWETARYRLKYCLKGPLNPKTTNNSCHFRRGFDTKVLFSDHFCAFWGGQNKRISVGFFFILFNCTQNSRTKSYSFPYKLFLIVLKLTIFSGTFSSYFHFRRQSRINPTQ